MSLKAGASRRDIDRYNTDLAELEYEQNPLLRKYTLAYRFRDFVQLRGSVGLGELPVTVGGEAYYATTDYSESPLGLRKTDDRRFGADVTWAVSENVSTFFQAGYEDIALRTVGSEQAPDQADWNSAHQDKFHTYGAGVDFDNIAERVGLRVNLLYAKGTGDTDVTSTLLGDSTFPQLETKLKSATVDLDYRLTDTFDARLRLRYEDFASSDWALQGIEPATLPNVLTLGADPYDYDVYLVSLSLRYRFGAGAPAASTQTEKSQ